MAGIINLTDYPNPLAQTVRITEPTGVVLTKASLFFSSAPPASGLGSEAQLPVTLELRPVVNGFPSSTKYIPGSRVVKSASDIRSVLAAATGGGTVWNAFGVLPEVQFVFDFPIYVPGNTEIAIVLYTNANTGQYKIWSATLGEFKWIGGIKSTAGRVSSQPAVGSLFKSSNGTTWTASQNEDIAFRLYRANFTNSSVTAVFKSGPTPLKNLSENNTFVNPLIFTSGSDKVKVIHPEHGYLPGDTVTLSVDTSASNYFSAGDTVAGILGSDILGNRVIDSADPYGYTITVGSSASSSIRAGGNGLLATEQYKYSIMAVKVPRIEPEGTSVSVTADLTTHASYADQTAVFAPAAPYQTNSNVSIIKDYPIILNQPHVLVDSNQQDTLGGPAAIFNVVMNTSDSRVAPLIVTERMNIRATTNWITYFDSDNTPATDGRQYSVVYNYVSDSDEQYGINPAKHLTVPYNLATNTAATSIRVLVDAARPKGSDFTVWHRTCLRDQKDIHTVDWVPFNKTPRSPNISNYNNMTQSGKFEEYDFTVFDLQAFDTYQIKITMDTYNDANVPLFKNLRTIAVQ